jgi:hypothetical protein
VIYECQADVQYSQINYASRVPDTTAESSGILFKIRVQSVVIMSLMAVPTRKCVR